VNYFNKGETINKTPNRDIFFENKPHGKPAASNMWQSTDSGIFLINCVERNSCTIYLLAHQSQEVQCDILLRTNLLASILKYNRTTCTVLCILWVQSSPCSIPLRMKEIIFLNLHIIRMCFGDYLLWAHNLLGANTGILWYMMHSPVDGYQHFTIT
jgi:hypothetical protein